MFGSHNNHSAPRPFAEVAPTPLNTAVHWRLLALQGYIAVLQSVAQQMDPDLRQAPEASPYAEAYSTTAAAQGGNEIQPTPAAQSSLAARHADAVRELGTAYQDFLRRNEADTNVAAAVKAARSHASDAVVQAAFGFGPEVSGMSIQAPQPAAPAPPAEQLVPVANLNDWRAPAQQLTAAPSGDVIAPVISMADYQTQPVWNPGSGNSISASGEGYNNVDISA